MRHGVLVGVALSAALPRSAAAQATPAATVVADSPERSLEWFMGGAVEGLLPIVRWLDGVGVGAQGAFRAGLSYRGFQAQCSPAAAVLSSGGEQYAALETTVSAGYLIPMSSMASWILRAGGGGGAVFGGPLDGTQWFGEVRVDPVGVAIRTSEHVFVDFTAPSFRLLFPLDGGEIGMTWVTSVGFHYVF